MNVRVINNTNIWAYVYDNPADDLIETSLKDIRNEYKRMDAFTDLYLAENKNLIFFSDIKH